jgi:hypothetical protein
LELRLLDGIIIDDGWLLLVGVLFLFFPSLLLFASLFHSYFVSLLNHGCLIIALDATCVFLTCFFVCLQNCLLDCSIVRLMRVAYMIMLLLVVRSYSVAKYNMLPSIRL